MVISSFFTGGLSAWSKGTMIPWWLGQWEGDLGKDFVVSCERNSMGLFSWRLVLSFCICYLNVFSRDRKMKKDSECLRWFGQFQVQSRWGTSIPSGSFSFLLLDLSSALDWPTSLLVPGVRLKLGCMCLVCALHCANPNSFSECFSNLSSSQLPLSPSHSKSGVKGSWGFGSGWCWENLHAELRLGPGRARLGSSEMLCRGYVGWEAGMCFQNPSEIKGLFCAGMGAWLLLFWPGRRGHSLSSESLVWWREQLVPILFVLKRSSLMANLSLTPAA